jgi:hypothetical protein
MWVKVTQTNIGFPAFACLPMNSTARAAMSDVEARLAEELLAQVITDVALRALEERVDRERRVRFLVVRAESVPADVVSPLDQRQRLHVLEGALGSRHSAPASLSRCSIAAAIFA